MRSRLVIRAPNYHPSEDNPNSNDYKDLPDHFFAVGNTIHLKAYSPGALITSGISRIEKIGGNWYFYGPVMVFSAGGLSTMVHELTHGLGMAHMCGNKDFTQNKTCLMTYKHLWIQDAAGGLIAWSADNIGLDLCAEHIVFIRKATLENDATPPGSAPPGWRILGW